MSERYDEERPAPDSQGAGEPERDAAGADPAPPERSEPEGFGYGPRADVGPARSGDDAPFTAYGPPPGGPQAYGQGPGYGHGPDAAATQGGAAVPSARNPSDPGAFGPAPNGPAGQGYGYGPPPQHPDDLEGQGPGDVSRRGGRRNRPGWVGVVAIAVASSVLTFGAVKATDSPSGGVAAASGGPVATATSAAPVADSSSRNPSWQSVAKAVSPSTVSIQVTSGQTGGEGTGIILNTKGDILTNNHVATGAGSNAQIIVTTTDGKSYEAKIVGTDAATDLAVIRFVNPPKGLKPAALGDSSKVTTGQAVMAVGTPLGLTDTVTTGIVSATHRPVQTKAPTKSAGVTKDTVAITSAIQTDAPINPGNSGGPLVNAQGQIIGINSSIASLSSKSAGGSSQSGSIGLGFAIPINLAENISSQLIANGKAQHGFLGVSLQDGVGKSSANSRTRGGEVVSVVSGSPAQSAGLQKGDVITKVGGVSVAGAAGVTAEIRSYSVGTKVGLTVLRNGSDQQLSAKLAGK